MLTPGRRERKKINVHHAKCNQYSIIGVCFLNHFLSQWSNRWYYLIKIKAKHFKDKHGIAIENKKSVLSHTSWSVDSLGQILRWGVPEDPGITHVQGQGLFKNGIAASVSPPSCSRCSGIRLEKRPGAYALLIPNYGFISWEPFIRMYVTASTFL